MQSDFTTKNAKNFYDKQGREYKFDQAAGDYVRQDPGGIKRFKLNSSTRDLEGGTGSTKEVIARGKLLSASDKFLKDFGRYQDLHAPLHIRH